MPRSYKVGKHRRIADYDAVRARYEAGETGQEIADSIGVTRQRIAKIVADIARPGARLPVEKSKVEANMEEIKRRLLQGITGAEIARSMGLSVRQLRAVISTQESRRKRIHPHGTINRFNANGCRCDKCREAYNAYHNARYHERKRKKMESSQ
jgi:predicted transcriptional regulator